MSTLKLMVAMVGGLSVLALGCGEAGDGAPTTDAALGDVSTSDDTGGVTKKDGSSKKANGAPCSGNGQCRSNNCAAGKCAMGTGAKGSACVYNVQCTSGFCVAGKCDGGGSLKPVGSACAKDGECASGICFSSKCAKSCTKPGDCPTGQICSTDNGKRHFCTKPNYNPDLGKFCGVTGSCPSGLTCVGDKYDWGSFCRGTCATDLNCPPAMECETDISGSAKYCRPRRMCSQCATDLSCPTGMKCVTMLGGKYCTRTCNPGSTECPMAETCKAVSGGSHACQPKTGSCRGSGGVCSGCSKNDHCNTGGICLSMSLSGETFCGSPCTTASSCGGNFKCYAVGTTGKKQCGPGIPSGQTYPSCSGGITFPIFNVGDVIDDFAMVGYKDTNNNGTLTDENTLQVIRLSHYASKAKLILLNISAFW